MKQTKTRSTLLAYIQYRVSSATVQSHVLARLAPGFNKLEHSLIMQIRRCGRAALQGGREKARRRDLVGTMMKSVIPRVEISVPR
jgi:hypothetical protein